MCQLCSLLRFGSSWLPWASSKVCKMMHGFRTTIQIIEGVMHIWLIHLGESNVLSMVVWKLLVTLGINKSVQTDAVPWKQSDHILLFFIQWFIKAVWACSGAFSRMGWRPTELHELLLIQKQSRILNVMQRVVEMIWVIDFWWIRGQKVLKWC